MSYIHLLNTTQNRVCAVLAGSYLLCQIYPGFFQDASFRLILFAQHWPQLRLHASPHPKAVSFDNHVSSQGLFCKRSSCVESPNNCKPSVESATFVAETFRWENLGTIDPSLGISRQWAFSQTPAGGSSDKRVFFFRVTPEHQLWSRPAKGFCSFLSASFWQFTCFAFMFALT